LNPEGAFYVFANTSEYGNGVDFTQRLLKEVYIIVTPGAAFGDAGTDYVRFSYATSMQKIIEGMDRIEEMLS
jgi:aspartate aminotransferase